MAPTQASSYPQWPLSLVCHVLIWDVQYTVYTWSWKQASESRIYHCISCGRNWNNHNRKWSLCRRHWDIRHRGLCRTSEAHRASDLGFVHADIKSLSFYVSLTEDLAVPPVIPRWWPAHLHTGFPGTSCTCTKLLGEGFHNSDEQKGAQARALVNTQFYTELFTLGIISLRRLAHFESELTFPIASLSIS